jgi:hypothetical protein
MTTSMATTSFITNQEYPIREPQNAQELVNLVMIFYILKFNLIIFLLGSKYDFSDSR